MSLMRIIGIILNKSLLQRTSDFNKLDIGFWVYKSGVTDKDTLIPEPYLKEIIFMLVVGYYLNFLNF